MAKVDRIFDDEYFETKGQQDGIQRFKNAVYKAQRSDR